MESQAELVAAVAVLVAVPVAVIIGMIVRQRTATAQRVVLQRPIFDGMLFGIGLFATMLLLLLLSWSATVVVDRYLRSESDPTIGDRLKRMLSPVETPADELKRKWEMMKRATEPK